VVISPRILAFKLIRRTALRGGMDLTIKRILRRMMVVIPTLALTMNGNGVLQLPGPMAVLPVIDAGVPISMEIIRMMPVKNYTLL
jgi:uncharacterized membrane protein